MCHFCIHVFCDSVKKIEFQSVLKLQEHSFTFLWFVEVSLYVRRL